MYTTKCVMIFEVPFLKSKISAMRTSRRRSFGLFRGRWSGRVGMGSSGWINGEDYCHGPDDVAWTRLVAWTSGSRAGRSK